MYIICGASSEQYINLDHQGKLMQFQGMNSSVISSQQCTIHHALPMTSCPLTTTHLKASSYPTYIERSSHLLFVYAMFADLETSRISFING